ncbi:MAG: copper amine oxidase N-terminal domain-containing protein [Clostridiales bacterium]|jgi:hypothetical protein|nr:copper amine oxidase N-terminal domain-containing protein [Clostridiales bacterium]
MKKVFICLCLTVISLAGLTCLAAEKASPTASQVLVDGKIIPFDAYNIKDNNYFKLRDIAYALRGTPTQFAVEWDAAKNSINLVSGKAYATAGGEMTQSGEGIRTAEPTTSSVYKDGNLLAMTAYNIGGNNYFKLRDIGSAFGFAVDWDAGKNTVIIDTGKRHNGANLAASMRSAEKDALILFLMNFSELGNFDYFDAADYDEKLLISYAIQHNHINSTQAVAYDSQEKALNVDGRSFAGRIPSSSVDNTILRYFGITGVKHETILTADHQRIVYHYENGTYYFEPADGYVSPLLVLDGYFDNGDGTFDAEVSLKWEYDGAPGGGISAKVAKHTYNGTETYKLLYYTEVSVF